MSEPPLPPFLLLQQSFAKYLRDPENTVPPGYADTRGLSVYQNAIITNTNTFLSNNFPKVREIIGADDWAAMVRDYVRRHRCETPLFVELPGEFLSYLATLRDAPKDPPFLYELAHFELLENVVLTDECELAEIPLNASRDFMKGIPILNPTSQLVRYAFPVHRIGSAYRPIKPPDEPSFILAYRDPVNEFKFLEVSPAMARVIELLKEGQMHRGESIMLQLAVELDNPDIDRMLMRGKEIFATLHKCGAILGVRAE